jgi:hypothetical protein
MAEIQLIINDEELDLKDGERIPLTFQTQSIQNITEARGNFSRSFDIPRTDKNNRLLETSYAWNNFGSLPYRRIEAVLKVDGQELPKGFVIVENDGLSETQIKLTYYSGNSNFFQLINELKLKDCDFGNASHLWNDTTIFDSRTNQYYVYPFIEYTNEQLDRFFSNIATLWDDEITYYYPTFVTYNGLIYLSTSTTGSLNQQPNINPSAWTQLPSEQRRIVASRMLPALYANTYKEAIEKTTGYKLEGRLFTLPIWTNLIFPFSLSKLQRQKKHTPDRINMDLTAWIGNNLAANTIHMIPLADTVSTQKKYGIDGFVPHVYSVPITTNIYNNTTGCLFFPDYTISSFKFKCRISNGVSNNIRFIIANENLPGDPDGMTVGDSIVLATLNGTITNSKTGAVLNMTLFPGAGGDNNTLKYDGLPISYNANPALNFDWIVEINFDFITGLQSCAGIRFFATAQNYFYETNTEIRFKEHIEHDTISTLTHGRYPTWSIGITYEGKNRVFVKNQQGALFYVYKLIDDSSLNDNPQFSPTKWESIGTIGAIADDNLFIAEANDSDYYDVKYGGEAYECSLVLNRWHPQYSWITGSDLVPDITTGLWIKNIANMFGCLLSVDDDKKIVKFKMWSEIYEDIPSAQEWTKLLVNPLKAFWNPRPTSVGQINYFKYAENDNLPIDYGYYSVNVDDEILPTEQTIYQLYFGATITESKFKNTYNAPYIPVFTSESEKISGEGKQRVLLIDKLPVDPNAATNPVLIQLRTGSTLSMTTNLPFCYFNDSNKAIQLGWDVYLFNEHHRWLEYIWNRYRVLNCELIIDSAEIVKIDLLKPVYIEYFQSYFFILKIQDWNPGKPCKVQLLKLQ